ncbi:hypothetical protein [Robertkochia aurantiaca]|uniref:hypothetical protein n=1 Tax=Robertkochia aurantiaca TaxID=2873700 RepID=UPI001CD00184|nr:hypothetical protein [Robertkochia sp. 3YJGBD-33]
MSKMVELVDSLEVKVSKLLHRLKVLERTNRRLEQEVADANQKISGLEKTAQEWEEKYHSLKMANSMLGSNENKTEAKLKINTLIREIDLCIAQLSE